MTKTKYQSDVKLGQVYRDEQTGLEGVATAIYFYQFGCERVTIEHYDPLKQVINSTTLDAPRLADVKTGKRAKVERTGGPGNGLEARTEPAAR
jgi:hypothetical protein